MLMKDIEWADDDSQDLRRISDGTRWQLCRLEPLGPDDHEIYYFIRLVTTNGVDEVEDFIPPNASNNITLLEVACLLTDFDPDHYTTTTTTASNHHGGEGTEVA